MSQLPYGTRHVRGVTPVARLQFYNDLGGLLMQFKENCKEWVKSRREEMRCVELNCPATLARLT